MGIVSLLPQVTAELRTWWPAVLAVGLLARWIQNYRKLSHIPGPFFAGVTDLWRLAHYYSGPVTRDFDLHQKYHSPLVRFGPNQISVSDPTAIKTIYGLNPVLIKGALYISHGFVSADGKEMDNLSSTRNEIVHARLRRPVNGAYAMTNLLDYEPLMDSTTDVFFRELTNRFVKSGLECDLANWLQYYAFDVLGEITFSKRFGFCEAGYDLENMLHHTSKHMDYLGTMGQLPWLDYWIRLRNPIVRKYLLKTNEIVRFSVKQIAEHTLPSDKNARPDFITRFQNAQEKYPDVMTLQQMQDYAVTNVSAGSDTTAIILRATIFYLLTEPKIYQRFMQEVKDIVNARTPDDLDRHISWVEANKMSYWQCIIKEALRIHPALGQMLPRVVPEGGLKICDKFIPAGTEIGCNAFVVHRSRAIYGEDADVFRPERWLDKESEYVKNMERCNFAFGGGTRTCIGRHIAMLEISKLVPEFFRRFEITLVDPKRYQDRAMWLVVQTGLDVKLKMRDPLAL